MIANNFNIICNKNYKSFKILSGLWNNIKENVKNQNPLNIIVLNIPSLNKNFEEHCLYLNNIERKFDLIILTEAWLGLQNIDLCLFNLSDYNFY